MDVRVGLRRKLSAEELCFWTVVFEKILESPLDCKEIQPVHSKGDQSWVFFEGLMLKLKLQYFGHLMHRVDSLQKTLMLGGIEGRRRRGRQMIEMAGWHHWLDGHKFELTPGVGDGQGGLACCNSWGRKESNTTERLNWSETDIFHRRRQWHPTPVLLPGKSHGWRSLIDCSPWGS